MTPKLQSDRGGRPGSGEAPGAATGTAAGATPTVAPAVAPATGPTGSGAARSTAGGAGSRIASATGKDRVEREPGCEARPIHATNPTSSTKGSASRDACRPARDRPPGRFFSARAARPGGGAVMTSAFAPTGRSVTARERDPRRGLRPPAGLASGAG